MTWKLSCQILEFLEPKISIKLADILSKWNQWQQICAKFEKFYVSFEVRLYRVRRQNLHSSPKICNTLKWAKWHEFMKIVKDYDLQLLIWVILGGLTCLITYRVRNQNWTPSTTIGRFSSNYTSFWWSLKNLIQWQDLTRLDKIWWNCLKNW